MRQIVIAIGLIITGLIFSIQPPIKAPAHLLVLEGEDTLSLGGKLRRFSKKELLLIPSVGDKLADEILKSKTLIAAKGVGRKTETKLKKFLDTR